ncbi:MAG: M13 family metallopeptidase [Urechidicola sp.]|nr:M13 family metallopeptidase [Urechidicola sp.]
MNTKYFKVGLLSLTIAAGITSISCEKEKEAPTVPGIDVAKMDTNTSPKEDFFKYVNGTWYDNTEIPSDRTRWGSFDELRQMTDTDALSILKTAMNSEELLDAPSTGVVSDQQKAVNLFETIMDTVSRDDQGIEPLKPFLAKIDEIENLEDLQQYMIKTEPYGGSGFFGVGVGSHPKNSNINAGYLGWAGRGLARDYYVDEDDDTKAKMEKYRKHVAKMLMYLGETEESAKANADKVLEFETSLAVPTMNKVDRRDARKRYNPKSMSDLAEMTPSINWPAYIEGVGMKNLDTIIVTDPNYFIALDKIFKGGDVAAWKNYLRWTLIDGAAGQLSLEIDKTNWEFYGRDLNGSKAQRDREERALNTLNGSIGEALGKLYVDEKFPPEAKEKAEKMIANVMKAFENRINNLEWMTDETKVKAVEKLNKLNVKIAYPDVWEDYSALEMTGVKDGGSYFGNMANLSKWNHDDAMEKLGKEVDKSEWGMPPQMVNAYFNPAYNEIVFPAAILQPPFYNWQADEAVNYGGIGAVIGHEISHCFDDSGSRYDADGNLNNWWTDSDLEQFTALGKKLADQYDAAEVLPGVNIDGAFTLGENIGDLGGINAAYDGLQLYMAENGRPDNIDGFTPEQRLFLSWGTIWRTKYRDDALRNQVKTDPHSPGKQRAVMPLQNVDTFYEAFDIVEGDATYLSPEERVKIW